MKRKLIALGLVLVMCISLCACGSKSARLEAAEDCIKLGVGKKYTIELKQGEVDGIIWESDDEAIATVSPDGTVTAVSGGSTVITGRTEEKYVHVGVIVEGGGTYVDENGNVREVYRESDITEIVVGVKGGSKNDVTIKRNDEFQLVAYTTPSDSEDEIVWESDKPSVVTVDENGKITARGRGTANITATAPNHVKGILIVRVN